MGILNKKHLKKQNLPDHCTITSILQMQRMKTAPTMKNRKGGKIKGQKEGDCDEPKADSDKPIKIISS